MTTYELQHRFDLEVAKYIPEPTMTVVVEDYLNYAYQQYITEKYDSLINPAEKFEVTERISRILAPLLDDYTTTTFVAITTNSDDGYYVAGPGETVLQYIIKESAILHTTDCDGIATTTRVKVIPVKHSMIEENKNNPFLKPDDTEIWRVNYKLGRIELILPEDKTLHSYTCRYIKKQTAINLITGVTMEIDSSVHEEIAVRAAMMYLSDLNNKNKKS
jgi:hypothetical protein